MPFFRWSFVCSSRECTLLALRVHWYNIFLLPVIGASVWTREPAKQKLGQRQRAGKKKKATQLNFYSHAHRCMFEPVPTRRYCSVRRCVTNGTNAWLHPFIHPSSTYPNQITSHVNFTGLCESIGRWFEPAATRRLQTGVSGECNSFFFECMKGSEGKAFALRFHARWFLPLFPVRSIRGFFLVFLLLPGFPPC